MLEKVKLYCNKNKLKKLKLFTFPIVISTVLLTGCGLKTPSKQTDNSTKYETSVDYLTEVNASDIQDSINNQYYDKTEDFVVEIPYDQIEDIDTYVSFTDEELSSFSDKIDDPVEYQYSEYFEISEALGKYEQFVEFETVSNNIINNNVVDTNKLYNIILENNSRFLNDGVNDSIFTEFTNKELFEICNIVSNSLNQKLSTLTIDTNELDSVLSNLKVLSYTKYEYAAITEDGCLAINKSMINTLNVEDAFEKIITHESMHLIQKSSQEEQTLEGYSKNVGMNYRWDDLKVNSLYNDWMIEASAEKAAAGITGEEINYPKKIAYLDALEISMAFDDIGITDLDLSKDLNKFYEVFGCNGLISKEEIATMMYAIDFINTDDMLVTSENEFLTNYKNQTGNELFFKEQQDLKRTYMGTIYKTLAKKMYYDLTNKLNDGSIKVTDAFSMIVLFETSCSKNTWYSVESYLSYNEDFIKEYNELQESFFDMIANKINMDIEDVKRAYISYHNFDVIISFTDKNDSLNDIYAKIRQNKSISISEMYNKISKEKTY